MNPKPSACEALLKLYQADLARFKESYLLARQSIYDLIVTYEKPSKGILGKPWRIVIDDLSAIAVQMDFVCDSEQARQEINVSRE